MAALLHSLTELVADPLTDLVLPRRCVGCAAAGPALCVRCLPVTAPLTVAAAGLPVVAAADYSGVVRSAILRFKERGRRDLVGPLAVLLAQAIRTALEDVPAGQQVVLVPVPSARTAAAARGGDHVARLARRAARTAACHVAPRVLSLTRAVQDSAGLDRAGRAHNQHGAMRARASPPGLQALVVDDIITTGSTLREAHRALCAAGWQVRGGVVIAATQRRSAR